jgi:RNA polymerase sigma-70 factor (ECF subfamily)
VSNDPAEEFFREHARGAYNLALRLCGNEADAEDISQEALLRAVRALPGFRGSARPTSWLYRIVVNVWKNKLRERDRRGWRNLVPLWLSNTDGEEEERPIADGGPPPEAAIEAEDRSGRVRKALSELDADDRAVVVLKDMERLSYPEIAETLDIPEGTVKSRLSRARESLRKKLSRLALEEDA